MPLICLIYSSATYEGRIFLIWKAEKWTTQETYSFSSRPRIAHTADYIASLNSIIVVGGTDKHVNGTIYDDAQLLNLDTWTWKEIMFRGVDGFPERIPRAWHASAVVGDQLFLMHSDPDLATNLVYKVLNIANWTYTNHVQPAPFSRKLKYSLQPENTTANHGSSTPLPSKETEFNGSKFVLVSTVGAMSGAALALLAALAFRKYKNWKREKRKKEDVVDTTENFPFHLTPIWANSYSRFDKQLEPFIPNITDNALWDLDSQYAYSTHMTFRGNIYQHPAHGPNSSYAADSLEAPIVRPRRWSSDAERTRPKALKEVPPCSTISELFMLTQSTIRQSWASFGKFSHKSYQEVAKQAETDLSSNEETMIPTSTSFPEDDAASSYSTLTDTHI
ncbi:hypothetical protein DSO57_1002906 [Entomophthora muscae]|uniref:Uncharacterized protein n=1 Tax=Entomophthora muscae TaxID=34485 RepID=A0ACC2SLF2_9FUNG|nr:hypothetical protein DSO57_1002906 [Entomophthora muscae]